MRSTSSRISYALPFFFYQATSAAAYSWYFKDPPKQCTDVVIDISGSDGKPPYRVLIIPYGPSPLANNVEARTILDIPFDASSTSLSFKLKYPENSQFVAVVSPSSLPGTLSLLGLDAEAERRWGQLDSAHPPTPSSSFRLRTNGPPCSSSLG
jgi:hypothetical protein